MISKSLHQNITKHLLFIYFKIIIKISYEHV